MKEKIYIMLNRVFPSCIDNAMRKIFGDQDFRTEWNIFSRNIETTWNNNLSKSKKKQIKEYCEAYSKGFADAMQQAYLTEVDDDN